MFDSVNWLEKTPNPIPSSNADSTSSQRLYEILLRTFPASWVINKSENNYLHYDIEISNGDGINGFNFSLRIVSSPSLRLNFATKDLKWVMDEADKPVFLVTLNPQKDVVFWLLLQDYIQGILEENNPHWRTQQYITIDIPVDHELSSSRDKFIKAVYYGFELLYIKKFYYFYNDINNHIVKFLDSPDEIKRAFEIEAAHLISGQSCNKHLKNNQSCTSCKSTDPLTELVLQADQIIQSSLEQAQSMKVLDPKDNRTAYYCISNALDIYGLRSSARIRYTALGEMAFYDYLLHFMNTYDSLTSKTNLLSVHPEDHKRYFTALLELTNIIKVAINEGEIIASSLLIIRLADTYLFTIPYLMRYLGQDMTAPLMDYAQSLLLMSHEMASLMESPTNILQ
ncbi:hypothetical protein JCM14036_27710 [Desulfotomaculum defluvii]